MSSIKAILSLLGKIIKLFFKIITVSLKAIWSLVDKLYHKFLDKLYFSITFKITTVYVAIFSFLMLGLSLGVFAGFGAYLVKNSEDFMRKDLQLITAYIQESSEIPKTKMDQISTLHNLQISVLDANDNILYSSHADQAASFTDGIMENQDLKVLQMGNNLRLFVENLSITKSIDVNQWSTPVLVLSKKVEWQSDVIEIQLVRFLTKEAAYLKMLTVMLFGVTLIFILVVLLIGSRTSRRMLRPVEKMTTTVKNITINDLSTRLDVRGSQDELKELAKTFNSMLDRIQQSYEQQNQFVSDASHELRTPISVIQGYANLLDRWGKNEPEVLEEAILSIKSEAESMKELIEKLLFLARGDNDRQAIEKTDFYLNELVDEIVKETKIIDQDHEITCGRNEKTLINADINLLKEAIRVFVDNSIKYTPKCGTIKLECYAEKGKAVVSIEDTGVGIAEEDLPHIFNRFYRADKSRTKQTGGTGLGLAIAKWIVFKHEGKIRVKSKVNEGTTIVVLLPGIQKPT